MTVFPRDDWQAFRKWRLAQDFTAALFTDAKAIEDDMIAVAQAEEKTTPADGLRRRCSSAWTRSLRS